MTSTTMIRDWLAEMQSCVRAVDYDRAERIFAPEVVAFGTFEGVIVGREALRAAQWSNVWPTIRDFTFRQAELHHGSDGELAWGICPWDSTGRRPDGSMFARPGRMTVILQRRESRWLAIHTHFSLFPAKT